MSMRVLMTTDCVGGVWRYAVSLAQELSLSGVLTILASMGPSANAKQKAEADAIPGLQLIETGLPLDWMAETEAVIAKSAQQIAGLAQDNAADLVHLNSPILAAFNSFDRPIVGVCHSCLATWWDAAKGGDLPDDFLWRTALVARGYNACDRLIAPSRAFSAMVARRYGILPLVVLNGADPQQPLQAVAKEPFVLTAGRLWDIGKNFAMLDEAAALIDAPIYAAGALLYPPVNEMPCRHAISLGELGGTEMRGWMQRASIYASVALYEPFGLAVLEAAQAGCALVLSDTEGFREIWGDAAVFVDPSNVTALSSTLQTLLDDAAFTAQLGSAARMRAASFSVDRTAKGMMAVYRSLSRRSGLAA
jgi:glycogen(starch) synthase